MTAASTSYLRETVTGDGTVFVSTSYKEGDQLQLNDEL